MSTWHGYEVVTTVSPGDTSDGIPLNAEGMYTAAIEGHVEGTEG